MSHFSTMNFCSRQSVFSIDIRCDTRFVDRLIKRRPTGSTRIFVFRTEEKTKHEVFLSFSNRIERQPEQSRITNDTRVKSRTFIRVKITGKRLKTRGNFDSNVKIVELLRFRPIASLYRPMDSVYRCF